jgi:hypothetical protein
MVPSLGESLFDEFQDAAEDINRVGDVGRLRVWTNASIVDRVWTLCGANAGANGMP